MSYEECAVISAGEARVRIAGCREVSAKSGRGSLPALADTLFLDDVPGGARGGTRIENVVEVRLLLDGLDRERREALVLTPVLGLSYVEATEVCGCRVGTIRSRIARARGDLTCAASEDGRAG